MDHVIASSGLRLSYLCDRLTIQRLDVQKILDDLAEPETRYALCGWFARVSLMDFDHVVLATNHSERHVAMLVANDGNTLHGPYLDLRAAIAISAMRGSKLMRRLLAYAVSRVSCLGTTPRAIAARTSVPACYRLLSLFSNNIPGAGVFPEPNAPTVDLGRARLARDIAKRSAPQLEYESGTGTIKRARLASATCFARKTGNDPVLDGMFERSLGSSDQMMVVVDMRACDEAAIEAGTRAMVRSRWKVPALSMESVAPSATSGIRRPKPILTA